MLISYMYFININYFILCRGVMISFTEQWLGRYKNSFDRNVNGEKEKFNFSPSSIKTYAANDKHNQTTLHGFPTPTAGKLMWNLPIWDKMGATGWHNKKRIHKIEYCNHEDTIMMVIKQQSALINGKAISKLNFCEQRYRSKYCKP